ncbi:M55 family metallopeptidase [Rhodopseudomonas palustris]|nr:M55 family metallopeptidase [Rhodopseudomonas palustris]
MNILISADIEGIGSIVRREHSGVMEREYLLARNLMTKEVNAAIRGAFDGGASEVLVVDAHNVGLNLNPEALDERARLIMGSPRPLAMMEGIDRGIDAVCFIGYHSMAGTADASIPHIFHGRIAELKFNGMKVGEIGLNALIAGYYKVPVIMISGDDTTCREARELLPEIETAVVKEAIGSYAGICFHPSYCQQLIYETTKNTLARGIRVQPLTLPTGEVTMEIRFTTSSAVDRAMRLPGTERARGDSIVYKAPDYAVAYKAFMTVTDLMELVHFI